MYTMPQTGTVAYNTKTYVGSFSTESGKEIIGELDFNRGLNGNIKASSLGLNCNYFENQYFAN